MKYKSILASTAHAKLRVRTLGLLAGVAAIAATAGPAAAQVTRDVYSGPDGSG